MLAWQSRRSRWFRLLSWFGTALVLIQVLGVPHALACRENAMIVFDSSGSMARRHGGAARIDIARRAAAAVLPSVTNQRRTGLITYGGIDRPACRDVVVRVKLAAGTGREIISVLRHTSALGPTALTLGVRTAADILLQQGAPGVIVLITDGLENCGGNTCALANELRALRPAIRVHVIGFFLDGAETNTLTCLSEATFGTFATANSLKSLEDALRRMLSCQQLSSVSGRTEGRP